MSCDISVLLPTRGRTGALTRSVLSLVNRAVKTDCLEILFGIDEDDAVAKNHLETELLPMLDQRNIEYSVMEFQPLGYVNLHQYANDLSANAQGRWLFMWNDDAIMDSASWDRQIIKHNGEFKVLSVHTHRDHPYSIFPIIPIEWYEQIGVFSNHGMIDAFVSQIGYMLNIFERIPVHVTHDRYDITGNNKDETYNARRFFEGNPNDIDDFHNPHHIAARGVYLEKLSKYMAARDLDISFWEGVKAKTQDPWAQLKVNDINNQMHQFNLKDFVK